MDKTETGIAVLNVLRAHALELLHDFRRHFDVQDGPFVPPYRVSQPTNSFARPAEDSEVLACERAADRCLREESRMGDGTFEKYHREELDKLEKTG